jgi:hypothetical protein
MPGGRKRRRDFATDEEWTAYKAEQKAKEDARMEEWAAQQRVEWIQRYEEWRSARQDAASELVAAWDALYTTLIATSNADLVRLANRLHRATGAVMEQLLDQMTLDDWPDEWIEGKPDPMEELPELFDAALVTPTSEPAPEK